MNDENIRREQRSFGARMSGTITAPAGSRGHRPAKPRQKEAPKGHEAFLKALELSKATVTIEKASSGDRVTGRIKASDKYTISMVEADTDLTRVIFKHDISEFVPAARASEATEEVEVI